VPLFVRGGAILPLGPPRQYVDVDAPGDSVSLLVYPDADSTFMLYEDDGVSRQYEHGSYALTEIRCIASDSGIRLRVDSPTSRTIDVRLYSPTTPSLVTLEDGAPVSCARDGERLVSFSMTLPSAAVNLRSE
jgi:alpha-glucosidase (family GH31 glycosyl hydrolase)